MITAKNYAAQAIRGLQSRPLIDGFQYLPDWYTRAVHFVLPDGGRIFQNSSFKSLRGINMNLPFPEITIEYHAPKSIQHCPKEAVSTRRIMYASQDEKDAGICFHTSSYRDFDGLWYPQIFIALLPSLFSEKGWSGGIQMSNLSSKYSFDSLPTKQKQAITKETLEEIGALLSFLEAISCRNVATANHQDAFEGNHNRIKDGKLPFYETKMLVIDVSIPTGGNTTVDCGTHTSPRQHLRRGHIRRYATHNIWVNSCVVGDPTKGFISKSYKIKKEARK